MSSDRDESYWLGVRDALRMIDSFVAWSRRNPARAKKLEDFVDDALIAVGKRCKSCLSQTLGISFAGAAGEEGIPVDFSEPEPKEEMSVRDAKRQAPETTPWSAATYPSEPVSPDTKSEARTPLSEQLEEMPDLTEETPLDLPELGDELARTEAEMMRRAEEESRALLETAETPLPEAPDISSMAGSPAAEPRHVEERHEERPREFITDFELIEPTPMILEPTESEKEQGATPPEIAFEIPKAPEQVEKAPDTALPEALGALEESFSAHGVDITLPKKTDEGPAKAEEEGITWDEYERAIMGSAVPEAPAEPSRPSDESVQTREPVPETQPTGVSHPAAESPPIWSPYDEPIVPETESPREESTESDMFHEGEDETPSKEDLSKTTPRFTRPPPPPPPPESEESEEERKRRARRLFFGT